MHWSDAVSYTHLDVYKRQALFPGMLALVLYYRALGRTPASRATLAELAFPVTAAVVAVVALGARPTVTQWIGFAVILVAVVSLASVSYTHLDVYKRQCS